MYKAEEMMAICEKDNQDKDSCCMADNSAKECGRLWTCILFLEDTKKVKECSNAKQ